MNINDLSSYLDKADELLKIKNTLVEKFSNVCASKGVDEIMLDAFKIWSQEIDEYCDDLKNGVNAQYDKKDIMLSFTGLQSSIDIVEMI